MHITMYFPSKAVRIARQESAVGPGVAGARVCTLVMGVFALESGGMCFGAGSGDSESTFWRCWRPSAYVS